MRSSGTPQGEPMHAYVVHEPGQFSPMSAVSGIVTKTSCKLIPMCHTPQRPIPRSQLCGCGRMKPHDDMQPSCFFANYVYLSLCRPGMPHDKQSSRARLGRSENSSVRDPELTRHTVGYTPARYALATEQLSVIFHLQQPSLTR